ncbi:MAG: prepilin-type N-terminal cleavage/methylation domain-containing protein [Phycisphaerales bacterium]|nr:prepilin-type N-terminal cleavage/methylation domain-containing protein [Phycisphaerales bacterium]
MFLTITSARASRAAAHIVLLVVGGAGLLKTLDLAAFADDVRTWELLPRSMIAPVAIGVPLVELGLGAAWLAGVSRRGVLNFTIALLGTFTLVFLAHVLFAESPRCGCFGLQQQFDQHASAAWLVIGRNCLLVVLGGFGMQSFPRRPTPEVYVRQRVHGAVGAGFTLLEILVVVVLLSLLIGLSMPWLHATIQAARSQTDLANLRTHVQIMDLYAGEYADQFPYTTSPRATYTVRRHPIYGARRVVYFEGQNTWHWPLIGSFYTSAASGSFASSSSKDTVFTDYLYSSNFLADARFWNEYTRTGPDQWRSTRLSDVAWPSDKGLLVQRSSLFPALEAQGGPTHVLRIGFVDGSARMIPYQQITDPYANGEGNWWGSWWSHGVRIMHTVDGVRGRDVMR